MSSHLIQPMTGLEKAILEIIDSAVAICDTEGDWVFLNHAADALMNYPSLLRQLPVEEILTSRKRQEIELRLERELGETEVWNARAIPVFSPDGQVQAALFVLSNSAEKTLDESNFQRLLEEQALVDPLTRLPNRTAFEKKINQIIADARLQHTQHVLAYLDLDQFKIVNDTVGHTAGDELLCEVAQRFTALMQPGEILARLGGDEFGVCLSNCSMDEAKHRLQRWIDALSHFHFQYENRRFRIGVSMGLVAVDADSASYPDLLSAADTACYAAKDKGRNRMEVYVPGNQEYERRKLDLDWAVRLCDSVDENHFELLLQRSLHRQGVQPYCEVLLRLRLADGRLEMPGAFIPAAERYRLMPQLDRWVVRETFRRLCEIEDDGTCYAINLSAQSISDEEFLQFVSLQLEESGIRAERICFELTETAAVQNLLQAEQFVKKIRALGCRFALDDFGSGFASFAHLKALQVDFVKIDGSYVREIFNSEIDRAVVESICKMARLMGKSIVAEAVETELLLAETERMGIDYLQGYAIHRPEDWPMVSA
ncbi:EAL domain-containing protein [Alicyclobacillus tolerans]|uniref:EAL domain-containing protein n=1 Tax=Alicyclobacillus tolerans TaxID=90970 RepID=UPI003B81FA40